MVYSSSQPYQSLLLGYRRRVPPEESGQLPECFVDLESGDLSLLSGEAPQFEGSNYGNGIKVVSGRFVQYVRNHVRMYTSCDTVTISLSHHMRGTLHHSDVITVWVNCRFSIGQNGHIAEVILYPLH